MKPDRFTLLTMMVIFYLFTGIAWATPPKPFEIAFESLPQAVPLNQETQVQLRIDPVLGWQSGVVNVSITAVPFVVPESNVESIIVSPNVEFGSSDVSNGVVSIPLTVINNGEFEIRLSVTLHTAKGDLNRTREFGVLAKNGLAWFGRDSIDHAVEAKIRYQVSSDHSLSPEEIEQKYRQALEREMQERAIRSRNNAGLTARQPQARAATAIKQGDLLSLEAWWVGQGTGKLGTTAGDSNFPMHGVKVTITDKGKDTNNNPLTSDISGYLVDGKFSFAAPRDNYSYKIIMETVFPGIKANGDIETTGNGIGSFTVVSQTSSGSLYKCEAEDTISVTCSQAQTGNKASASAWSALHGMAEMVLQARKQLKVDKKSGFKVIFDRQSGTSSYNGSDINMLLADRYDWDVIAHEFGHAIADETNAIDTNTGGPHDGSNQYDYMANTSTFHNKPKSLELAISEGFGTWFGGALMQNPSAKYNGKFQNIGDGKYDDTEDANVAENFEQNTATAYFGEDTENALYRLLWDIMDSNNEANSRASCPTCKDSVSLNLNGLWAVLNGSKISNIIEFYEKLLDKQYNTKVSDLLKSGENNISDAGLQGALDVSYTFAEFGIAPYLEKPAPKTKLDLLKDKNGPEFQWSQKKTGTLEGLTDFTLALYTFDKKTLVFKKSDIKANGYTLTEADIKDIKSSIASLSSSPSSLIAVIVGENGINPNSGPYLSNPIEIEIHDVDRTLVVAIDSSGSNTTTDPSNLRITAAKETIGSLTSLAEAQANNTVPDLAGAVDFDSGVTILSQLDDPDAVIPKITVDSSGGTDIAAGIDAAVQILENINTAGLTGLLKDKAAIVVFTDGNNNAGPLPVIQAIVNATLKGVRVHYGFLNPISFTKSGQVSVPSDAPPGYVRPEIKINASALPVTIEEAVLASGGVYALIGDAESQVAFVRQIENRGFTNADNTDPGGQNVVGQTKTFDIFVDSLGTRSFQFRGQMGENVRVIVDTQGNFHPFLKIIDRDGNIIAVDDDADADGIIKLDFTLPYTGTYHAEITSQDGKTGLFSIFVDVQNASSHTLTVNKTGEGTIISNPTGINCGSACVASFAEGAKVTLRATPENGYSFNGWLGDCSGTGSCTLTMDTNKTVTATFVAIIIPEFSEIIAVLILLSGISLVMLRRRHMSV